MNFLRHYRQKLLLKEYKKIKSVSPSFSLRSFARFLGISPSTLSRVFQGKLNLSDEVCFEIAKKLKLEGDVFEKFTRPTINLLKEEKNLKKFDDEFSISIKVRDDDLLQVQELSHSFFCSIEHFYAKKEGRTIYISFKNLN